MNNAPVIFNEIPGKHGSLGIIILNRPDALNALTTAMIMSITSQLVAWANASHIKAVIIGGAGERAFCAGGDIRTLYEKGRDHLSQAESFFWHEYRLNQLIYYYPKPFIALLHGIVMGGGAGVSVHGSHRIAAENLLFAMPETGIGFFPDIGATHFLPRCRDNIGYYLGLTGQKINAADALFAGLIDQIVPQQQFEPLIAALAENLQPHTDSDKINTIIAAFATNKLTSDLMTHATYIKQHFADIDMKKIMASLAKDKKEWCQQTLQTLSSKCPTSLLVTLAALHRGVQQDINACLKMEYQIAAHFLRHHDFYEGVRAAIIDKDRNPRWQPSNLEEANQTSIQRFFAPVTYDLVFID